MPETEIWPVLALCAPTFLGFALFLVSFPIDRQLPVWPRLNLVEVFTLWFIFVTPVTTITAIVSLLRRKRRGRIPRLPYFLLWSAIAVCFVVNALMVLGLIAATT
jgi:hypothetical protein